MNCVISPVIGSYLDHNGNFEAAGWVVNVFSVPHVRTAVRKNRTRVRTDRTIVRLDDTGSGELTQVALLSSTLGERPSTVTGFEPVLTSVSALYLGERNPAVYRYRETKRTHAEDPYTCIIVTDGPAGDCFPVSPLQKYVRNCHSFCTTSDKPSRLFAIIMFE